MRVPPSGTVMGETVLIRCSLPSLVACSVER
jgi:hypothetical protein